MTEPHLSTEIYSLTAADTSAFFNAWSAKRRLGRANLIRFGVIAAIMTVLSFVPNILAPGPFAAESNLLLTFAGLLVASIIFAALTVFLFVPTLGYILHMVVFLLKRRPSPQSVALIPEGLIKRQNGSEEILNWSTIHDVIETKRTILVFTNPSCAMIVPKRAFTSTETLSTFMYALDVGLARDDVHTLLSRKKLTANAEQVF